MYKNGDVVIFLVLLFIDNSGFFFFLCCCDRDFDWCVFVVVELVVFWLLLFNVLMFR